MSARVFRHRDLNTKAKRMGRVIRARQQESLVGAFTRSTKSELTGSSFARASSAYTGFIVLTHKNGLPASSTRTSNFNPTFPSIFRSATL